MPFVLRTTTEPTLTEIASIPQIVIIDLTGPTVFLGASSTSVVLVGEFLKGSYDPTEVTSGGEIQNLYGTVSPFFSQSAAGVQDGSGSTYNGNGMLQLKSKSFKRLVIQRVDMETVSTDGGSTASEVTLTLTVAAADRNDAGSATKRDLTIPAGTRLANDAIGTAVQMVAVSQDVVVPAGTATSSTGHLTVDVPVFVVFEPHPIVVIAIAAIDTVIDSFLAGGSASSTITACTNAVALWPPGTGTTLSQRIETRYLLAIDKTLPGDSPVNDVAVIWSARRSTSASVSPFLIQQRLLLNATDSSNSNAQGRIAVCSPEPAAGVTPTNASNAKADAITYASDATIQGDRMVLCWPHTQIFSEELGSIVVTINPEGWMASVLSNFAEEVNPGADNNGLMDSIVALEPCFVANKLSKQDYANLQAAGICGVQKDRVAGWWFINGVTAVDPSTEPTRVPIKRRRMADFIQASLVDIAAPYLKQPATTERIDAFVGGVKAFLDTLLSLKDPSRQRIVGFSIDQTLNDPQILALGIFTLGVNVRTIPSMDDIVLRTQIGETVIIPVQQAA